MSNFLHQLPLFPTAVIGSLPRPAWLLDLLQDSARMERLGEDGRTWVQEYHSAQTVAKLYADEYRKLL